MNLIYLVFTFFAFLVANSLQANTCDFDEQGVIWTPCGDHNVTDTQCTDVYNCCVAPEKFLKKRNWTETCLNVSKSPGITNGTCKYYNGSVCFQSDAEKNSTNIYRYIDSKIGMEQTDEIFGEFFEALRDRAVSRQECTDILSPAMCTYGIPACYYDGTPQQICREDCEHIMELCKDDLSKLLGAIQYISLKKRIDFAHLAVLEGCGSFQYSYEIDSRSNKTCAYLFKDLDRSRPVAAENSILPVIAAVSAAVVLVITIVVIILVLRHLRRKQQMYKGDHEGATSMTSIRDRIRQDSYVNPLMELLASSKPGELVQYPLDCVEYIRDLGEGQFGKVFQGRVHGVVKGEESTDVAVKCLKEGSTPQALDEFHKEVALMSVLQHGNILRLLAVSTEEEPYCMIFEFMENGDLNEYLRKWKGKEHLSDNDLIKICKHVAAGMEYLASKKFLHRDLATRNCLVGTDMFVKIADFGMSRNIYHSDYYRVGGEAMLPIRWMPPEAILYGKFTVAADVFSFGVVLWEIFSFALQPFYGYSNEEVIDFIKKGVLLPQPEDCPEWIYNIMLECWKREPEDRMSFSQALKLLKGQFPDYDEPRGASPSTSAEGYDVVTVIPPESTYDQVPLYNEDEDEKVAPTTEGNQYYQNVKTSTEKNPSLAEEAPCYQNIKPSQPHQNNDDGHSNDAFDNDNNLTASLVPAGLRRTSKPSNKTNSLPKVRKSIEKKALKVSKTDSYPRGGGSLGGGRSIKDVLKEDARYVSGDSLAKAAEPADAPSRHIQPSFRPSSEFLQFHGYGEDIQAADPDERNMIKKIIEGDHSKHGK